MRRSIIAIAAVCLLPFCGGCAHNVWQAARNGDLNGVKKEIQARPELVNAEQTTQVEGDKNNHWTPLHYAVDHQHPDVVKYLLDQGADPLANSNGNMTPLMSARRLGNRKIEDMLVKNLRDAGRPLPEDPAPPPNRPM